MNPEDKKVLKRQLTSCGHAFFVENYYLFKSFHQKELSREQLENKIREWSPKRGQDISTITNRISGAKLFFERNEQFKVLQLCIESKAKEEVISLAKKILNKETSANRDPRFTNFLSEKDYTFAERLLDYCISRSAKPSWDEFTKRNPPQLGIKFPKHSIFASCEVLFTRGYARAYIRKRNPGTIEDAIDSIRKTFEDVHEINKNKDGAISIEIRSEDSCSKLISWIDGEIFRREEGQQLAATDLFKFVRKAHIIQAIDDFDNNFNHGFAPSTDYDLRHGEKLYPPKAILGIACKYVDGGRLLTPSEFSGGVGSSCFKTLEKEGFLIIPKNSNLSNYGKNKIMKIPLNQIFYGPPGTGKTYNLKEESEKIINQHSESVDTSECLKRISDYLLSNFPERNITNGNNFYRNANAIAWVWGWFLDFKNSNFEISKNVLIEAGFSGGPSSWSQRIRYITHFGFVDDWNQSSEIKLNQKGIDFCYEIEAFLRDENKSFDDLKNWGGDDLPLIFIEKYLQEIEQCKPSEITPFIKSIQQCLLMAESGALFRQNSEGRDSTENEVNSVRKFFDFSESSLDTKWIGWHAKVLEQLGLVEQIGEEKESKYFYRLTPKGNKFLKKLIDNWKHCLPDIFNNSISYKDALSLGRIVFVTFHQSYSYEEFVEGIRPNLNDGNQGLNYSLEKGVFKRISQKAEQDPENNYVIIIDEINRGNISKIFGELITLIEDTKRLGSGEQPDRVTLPYSKQCFGVPPNLYLLGTMNTADKSIALLDSALRRRFVFKEMLPNSTLLEGIDLAGENGQKTQLKIKNLFETINKRIEVLLDKDHMIGHSYFYKLKDDPTLEKLCEIFREQIIPLLSEYFFEDVEKVRLVLGDDDQQKKRSEFKILVKKDLKQIALFGTELEEFDEKVVYEINEKFGSGSDDLERFFISIYDPKMETLNDTDQNKDTEVQ